MSSLIPGRQIVFSAELAATIGLEEAVLLQCLSDESERMEPEVHKQYQWFQLSSNVLRQCLPFWQDSDMQRILEHLRQQGVILISSAPISESNTLRFAFDKSIAANKSVKGERSGSKEQQTYALPKSMEDNWQPSESCFKQLAQHGVPKHFADQRVSEFVLYWKERGEPKVAWENKFFKRVLADWRNYESSKKPIFKSIFDSPPWALPEPQSSLSGYAQETPQEYTGKPYLEAKAPEPMTREWRPSLDSLNYLTMDIGVSEEFIKETIPKFILFWLEKGAHSQVWNHQFTKHVKTEWEKFNHNKQNNNIPTTIPRDWLPSDECYTMLEYAEVDLGFVEKIIPEFIMYWTNRNELQLNWDNTFYKTAKREWAEHLKKPKESIKEKSFRDRLNDQSW